MADFDIIGVGSSSYYQKIGWFLVNNARRASELTACKDTLRYGRDSDGQN
jgi:hypothetical protein